MINASRRKLCEVAKLIGGGTPSRNVPEYFGGKINWVTPTDLPAIGEVGTLKSPKGRITEVGLRNSSAKLCPPGSVLFSSRASIGKIAVADAAFTTNQGFCNFVPFEGVLDPWFLAYYLAASRNEIVSLAGETTFKEVSKKKLATFEIPVPPLDEQRRIVGRIREAMERVDELRRLRNKAEDEAKALFGSFLHRAENDAGTNMMTMDNILVDSRNGRSIKSSGDHGTGRILTLASVREPHLDVSKFKWVEMDDGVAKKYRVAIGDVFISHANTVEFVGLSAIAEVAAEDRVIYPDLMIRLSANDAIILPKYLVYALRFPYTRKQIQERATGSSQSMVKISGKRLRSVEIPVPKLAMQQVLIEGLASVNCALQRVRH